MIGISTSRIIESLARDCIIPCEQVYLEGCSVDAEQLRIAGIEVREEDLVRCFNRVRYSFSVIRSTRLAYEGKHYVYLVPCLMYYRERYGDKWTSTFKRHVKFFVEPFYDILMNPEDIELERALRYSRRIPGYYDLKAIATQLAIINKSITSTLRTLETITLRDGTKINVRDYISRIVEETLQESYDSERAKRLLEFRIGLLLGTIQGRLNFMLELFIGLLTIASFSQRPWHKPAPTLYKRYLEAYQSLYREKLEKAFRNNRTASLNPAFQDSVIVIENMIKVLMNISKLMENTRNYINTYYPKTIKNTRSVANRLLTGFVTSKLFLSMDSSTILNLVIERILSK